MSACKVDEAHEAEIPATLREVHLRSEPYQQSETNGAPAHATFLTSGESLYDP